MQHLTKNLKTLSLTLQPFVNNNACLQSVRWKRKPIWLGTAKSKIFRIPKKPQIPLEETEELKRLFNNYRTRMKSINSYLTSVYSVSEHETFDEAQHKKKVEEDFTRCMELNDKWNADLKIEREARIQKELDETIQKAKEKIAEQAEIARVQLEKAEEMVRKQKALSATFITRDNIDQAIERAIATQTDYNFAIDMEGNRIAGREATPPEKVETEKQQVVQ